MLAEINGAQLAYDDVGQGSLVLFVHAGIADRSMWDHQISHFSRSNRVIALDLRGFGDSNMPELPYANHEDANTLLNALAVGPATVVGVSLGGTSPSISRCLTRKGFRGWCW